MNLGRLAKQLKKELAAKPKHAAALGVGLLIAIWFWAPLIMGKSKTTAAAVPVAEAATPSPAAPTRANAPAAATTPWRQVATWRNADPLTLSVAMSTRRNPFTVKARPQLAPPVQLVDDVTPQTIDPEKPEVANLGITLESIAYRPGRSRAQVNGVTMREGEASAASEDKSKPPFRVLKIRPTEIDVELDGRMHTVTLKKKPLAPGEVFQPVARQVPTR